MEEMLFVKFNNYDRLLCCFEIPGFLINFVHIVFPCNYN